MGGSAPLQTSIYFNKSIDSNVANANIIEGYIREFFNKLPSSAYPFKGLNKFRQLDPHEPPFQADINIFLDFPVYSSVPWGLVNIAFRNNDASWNEAFTETLGYGGFDFVITKDEFSLLENRIRLCKEVFDLIQKRRPTSGVVHYPPVLNVADCPPISIITPTFNRKNMLDIAFHNLLSTDYPIEKIEWVVIEDAEKSEDMASDKIINFKINNPKISIKYIPIQGRMTIGEKRNHAIEHSSNEIILFMDDDDHYPSTSFRRRVAWLLKGKRGESESNDISVCTTIALYDLKKGVSAVNVPPWDLPLQKRISEATLTFKKSYWMENKFPMKSMAEGEEWIIPALKNKSVIEIPPQQIIVAFSHGQNASERRIPPSDAKVGCFWGFPKEYLIFVHKLAGVEVVEDKGGDKK
jgi:hypothetical protein